ncbi:uncharacterized protein LOC121809221 [Salvia splendens]|uniref:uncharacterized protein LOC121809221 n=1 Tax=Salvia splendens TaxID=180675 RepID=UPI001C2739BE|nr:uncharacterized protein LOC121809221 [Salvia splendens]
MQNFVLADIEKLLMNVGKSLCDYHGMSYLESQYFKTSHNTLISDELCYDREALRREHLEFLSKFTDEKLHVHDTITSSVNSTEGIMFFVHGYGGTGKTFIWRSLSAEIRSKGDIVLNVASSGIASLFLPGDGEVVIDLPSYIVLSNAGDPLKTIAGNIYPSYMDLEELSNCLHDHAILAPTLDVVDEVNQFMISMDQSHGQVYLSSDSILNSDSTNGSAEIH